MTYGRVHFRGSQTQSLDGASVSHLAELVRGHFFSLGRSKPPHPPFGPLLPKGRRGFAASLGEIRQPRSS